ncbi:nuclease-related domain-containing protein [Deinococcus sp.]|uniref:nuclease-related domain-containing protein n=1 Tax=Deinococcus sp. TaxID=47478 RepID=UPI00391BBEAF
MIVKDLEPQTHTDPLRRAGYEAERQMAHYLKRAFAEDPDISVLNNLRVERNGEFAQVDHLILHRHGMILVESKSVTAEISVNERGEWARHWKGQARGVRSPVLQARLQGELLHALLKDHAEQLLGKIMLGKVQKGFGSMHVDVIVAISDSGVIRGGAHVPSEVLKADQVPDRIRELSRHYRKANSLFSLNFKDSGYEATAAELAGIASFLRARHVPALAAGEPVGHSAFPPRPVRSGQPEPVFEAAPLASPERSASPVRTSQERQAQARPRPDVACRACSSVNVTVQFGKYGYYLKCADCGGNTPAKPVCAACGQPGKVSKRGLEFTASCAGGHSWAYWTNPA